MFCLLPIISYFLYCFSLFLPGLVTCIWQLVSSCHGLKQPRQKSKVHCGLVHLARQVDTSTAGLRHWGQGLHNDLPTANGFSLSGLLVALTGVILTSSGLRITLPELLLPGVGFLPFNPTFSCRKFHYYILSCVAVPFLVWQILTLRFSESLFFSARLSCRSGKFLSKFCKLRIVCGVYKTSNNFTSCKLTCRGLVGLVTS